MSEPRSNAQIHCSHLPSHWTIGPLDPFWDPQSPNLAIYGVTKWSEWSVLMPPMLFQPCSTLFQPFLVTRDHIDPIVVIQAHLDPFRTPQGPNLAIYGVAKWSEWSVLMPPILFQPCSTLFQPFLGTRDHLDPIVVIQTHLDPFQDPLESKFWPFME